MNGTPRRGSRLRWILLAAVVVAGGWIAWHKEVRDHFVPRNFGVVEEGVMYRSGRLTERATRLVHERHGIKTIIDLGAYDHDPVAGRVAQRTAEALGMTRYEFRLIGDATGNPNYYVAALRILADPANHPVLVHCSAGAERTSACTMLYLKAFHDRPFLETYPAMGEHKHSPGDNPRLMSYLADHGAEILEAFRRGVFIPGYEPVEIRPVGAGLAEEGGVAGPPAGGASSPRAATPAAEPPAP